MFASCDVKFCRKLNPNDNVDVDGAAVVTTGCADVPDVDGDVALPRIILHIRCYHLVYEPHLAIRHDYLLVIYYVL